MTAPTPSRAAVPLATALAALAVCAMAVLSLGSDPAAVRGWWPAVVGSVVAVLLGLCARRAPRLTVVASCLTGVLALAVSGEPGAIVPLTLAGALAAAQAWPFVLAGGWRVGLLLGSTAATTAAVVAAVAGLPAAVVGAAAVWTVCLSATAYLYAVPLVRARRKRAKLQASLDHAAREIAVTSRRAVLDERVRIARDLHDSAGHLVTAVNIHAAAAHRALDREPQAAAEAIGTAEEYSRLAVLEIQSVLRVLEGQADNDGREPGLEELEPLVEQIGRLGLTVTVSEVGQPVPLSPAVSAAGYRVVREGLVNVRKHSAAGEARVVLRWPEAGIREDVLEVEVVDPGPPAGSSAGSGIGLRGLRERVALERGTMTVGRLSTGGFHVLARLPLGPRVPHDTTGDGSWH